MNLSHSAEQQAYGLQMLYLATKRGWSWRDIAFNFCRGGKGPSGDPRKDQRAVLEFEKMELGKGLSRIWKEQVEPRIKKGNQATGAKKGDCFSQAGLPQSLLAYRF